MFNDIAPYHYGLNNPILGNDPTGLMAQYSSSKGGDDEWPDDPNHLWKWDIDNAGEGNGDGDGGGLNANQRVAWGDLLNNLGGGGGAGCCGFWNGIGTGVNDFINGRGSVYRGG
jgi:hypothetical protein